MHRESYTVIFLRKCSHFYGWSCKITGFDIARRRKQNQNADTTILGTVGFASPEQYGFLQTDATADIYALGVLMNVMLEGTLPNVHLTARKPFCNVIKDV